MVIFEVYDLIEKIFDEPVMVNDQIMLAAYLLGVYEFSDEIKRDVMVLTAYQIQDLFKLDEFQPELWYVFFQNLMYERIS